MRRDHQQNEDVTSLWKMEGSCNVPTGNLNEFRSC